MEFVTGGTGFLGSHLLYNLISNGHKVRALRRKESDIDKVKKVFSFYTQNYRDLFNCIEWVEGDTMDYYSLLEAMEGITNVYHTAAIVSFDPAQRDKMIHINTQGTANVVNVCLQKHITKLCFLSSIAALGDSNNGEEIDENNHWDPAKSHSAYSFSKFHSEMEVWRGINEGLSAIIVNPSIILGPGDWENSSPSIFPTLWKGLKLYTNGITGYVDVADVAECSIQLMKSDITNERFILSSENLSFREVFTLIANSLGKTPPSILAKPWMTNLAWRLDWLKSKIFSVKRTFTKENAKSAHAISYYSSKKIHTRLGFKFKPIHDTLSNCGKLFLAEYHKNQI